MSDNAIIDKWDYALKVRCGAGSRVTKTEDSRGLDMIKKANFQAVIGFEDKFESFHIDPLHGPIGITKVESKIIESEYFQRLKYIRQLGLVHHFYHSATHWRPSRSSLCDQKLLE